jgi:hypothetical protein
VKPSLKSQISNPQSAIANPKSKIKNLEESAEGQSKIGPKSTFDLRPSTFSENPKSKVQNPKSKILPFDLPYDPIITRSSAKPNEFADHSGCPNCPRPCFLPDRALCPGEVEIWADPEGYTPVFNPKRQLTDKMRLRVVERDKPPFPFTIEHLIPLRFGGTNGMRNLWALPAGCKWGPVHKLALENELARRMRKGLLTLGELWLILATNWVDAYLLYVKGSL